MIGRAILPGLSVLLWGLLVLSTAHERFSNAAQEQYYFWVPLLMAGMSAALIVLRDVKYARLAVQCLSMLMLTALLPYLLFYTGGM